MTLLITKLPTPKPHLIIQFHYVKTSRHSLTYPLQNIALPIYHLIQSPEPQIIRNLKSKSNFNLSIPSNPPTHQNIMTTPATQERTTLTGQPITKTQDNLSNVMLGDGGAGFNAGTVGANLLPPGYTDASLVRIPIKISQYLASADNASATTNSKDGDGKKKSSFLKRAFNRRDSRDSGDLKIVEMSRGEYLKYWAKGSNGEFLDSVVEPPGGRGVWLKEQLEFNEGLKAEKVGDGKESV
jgi:hypothetical protein